MSHAVAAVHVVPDDVAERLAFADAALALAGHEVTDPVLLRLSEARACGEISGEEFRSEARRRVLGR